MSASLKIDLTQVPFAARGGHSWPFPSCLPTGRGCRTQQVFTCGLSGMMSRHR